uniref:Uncharacterized protein n=1 Tax=Arundo donax TaxID=35708 RepID=A0A0A9BLN3_ARUDO
MHLANASIQILRRATCVLTFYFRG